jgi:putative ABC transport system permease protein
MTESRPWVIRSRYTLVTAFALALDSIRAHKLRTFLTLLGVIIGVASVVLVGAAIEGLGLYAEESTAKVFGSETFLIAQVASATSSKEYFDKIRRNKFVRYGDYEYLNALTGDRIIYSPHRSRPEELKHNSDKFEDGVVVGVSAALPLVRDVVLVEGRFFTEEEDRTRQFVVVIGDDVRAAFFPTSSPLGRVIKIAGGDFRVIGVLERLGTSFGRGQDNVVYVPSSAFTRLYGTRQSFLIYGRARPETGLNLEDALDIARVALRTRFRARLGQPDNFDNITPEGVRAWVDGVLGLISGVVVPVTCISLLVGGIVIMNIMLVSVTERTHEIGIRKSLGARPADIRLQFLIEAVLMAAAGGAVGIVLGATATELLSRLFGISLRVSADYIAVALLVSSSVGIASGWYPASRASRLDPVVALRME